jgi:hypothetical protein
MLLFPFDEKVTKKSWLAKLDPPSASLKQHPAVQGMLF